MPAKTSKNGLILAKDGQKGQEIDQIKPSSAQVKESGSIEQLLLKAVESNVPVETLERLFSLREKVKAEQAKESFISALSSFQSEVPVIKKTKDVLNKDGRTVRYSFAPLDSIVEQIKESLKRNGLSYNWTSENKDGTLRVTATVTHILGHSESSEFEVPIDKEGYMTAPQKVASALTFAKRYSLCGVLGIASADEDIDATDVNKEKDVKSKRSKIILMLRQLGFESKVPEDYRVKVKELTNVDLKEENFEEIVARLSVLIDQKNENA